MLDDRAQVLVRLLEAHAPVLEDDVGDAAIGQHGVAVEHRHAGERHDLVDARRRHGDLADLFHRRVGALQRGAVGQLQADQHVALVLVGDERRRQARHAPAAEAGDDEGDEHHDDAATGHLADQPGVAVLELAVDLVEAAEEDVALLRRHRGPEPQGALGGLQGRGVDRADEGGGRDHQGELGEHLAGQAGHEGGRQEHRHQHQRDADHRPEQLAIALMAASWGVMPRSM